MTAAQISAANRNPIDFWTGLAVIILWPIGLAALGLWMLCDFVFVQRGRE